MANKYGICSLCQEAMDPREEPMCSQCIRSRDASSCCARRHCRNPQCSGPSQAAIPPMQCMLVTCLAAVPPLTLQSLRTGGPVAKTMHACAKLGGSAAARNAVMSNRLQCRPCNACYCQAWRQFSHRQFSHRQCHLLRPCFPLVVASQCRTRRGSTTAGRGSCTA